jgi:ribonuclease HII
MLKPDNQPVQRIAGVDEAGRGPLAGPVAVAAVILGNDHHWSGIDDSKRLTATRRAELATLIKSHAMAWHVCLIQRDVIDKMNILQATLYGMQTVVAALDPCPTRVLVDGNRCPEFNLPSEAIIGGDGLEKCIGAASILAKTERDAYMVDLDRRFPEYGFARHKGYPTPQHLEALARFGPMDEHRRSFAPVRNCLQGARP